MDNLGMDFLGRKRLSWVKNENREMGKTQKRKRGETTDNTDSTDEKESRRSSYP
jgi:hypothetical protein